MYVKIITNDNTLEFDDYQCKIFVNQNGIIHQTCVNRPQQNSTTQVET